MIDPKQLEKFSIDKSDWRPVKFGEVVFEPKESVRDPRAEGIAHVVGLEHIDSADIHLRRWAGIEGSTTFSKKFSKGDVLFGRRRAYLKKAAQAPFDGICSGDITVLRAGKKLLPELLPFLVNNDKFFDYAVTHSAGGLSPRVKFKDLANYEFLLPPKERQAELAELLWAQSVSIKAYEHAVEKISMASLARQRELFSDPTFESKNILDVAIVKRGKFTPRPRNDPKFFGGNIPFIQTGDVTKVRTFINDYSQTLNQEGLAVSKLFPAGTIVMVIAGTVGSAGILTFDCAFTDSLVGIKSKVKFISQKYLFYFLRFHEKTIDNLGTEVAQKNLSIDSFKKFIVSYPKDTKAQEKIVKEISNIDNVVDDLLRHISNAERLLTQLINQIF